jgi:hypothetical protein
MYLTSSLLVVLATFTSAALGVPSKIPARDSTGLTLQQQLELAGTAVNRLALIPNDQDFIFDFNASTQGITQGQGTKNLAYMVHIYPNPLSLLTLL